MVGALAHEMRVREVALGRFGQATVRNGRPLALLEEVLVPLYLRHRYQIEATVKLLGGVEYTYALRGDSRNLPTPVSGELQRMALAELMKVVQPEALSLPKNIRTLIPPRPPGYPQHRELFTGHTGLTFDPYTPAAVVAGLVLGLLVHPERAARMTYQADFDPKLPDFEEILEVASSHTWGRSVPSDPYAAELQRVAQQVWIDELVGLASNLRAAPAVRVMTTQKLREIHAWLQENPGRARDEETLAHRAMVFDQIDRYLLREYRQGESPQPITVPPGSPIGQTNGMYRIQERQTLLQQYGEKLCRGGGAL